MRCLFVCFYLIILSITANAQIYQCKDGSLTLTGDAPLEKIVAKSSTLEGLIALNSNEFNFRQNMNNFTFSQGQKQKKHAEEKYWETDQYPYAQYKGKITDDVDLSQEGTYEVTTSGTFTLHGVSNKIKVPGTVTVKDDQLHIEATFEVKLPDYNITVPEMMFMKVSEAFEVKVDAALTQKN